MQNFPEIVYECSKEVFIDYCIRLEVEINETNYLNASLKKTFAI